MNTEPYDYRTGRNQYHHRTGVTIGQVKHCITNKPYITSEPVDNWTTVLLNHSQGGKICTHLHIFNVIINIKRGEFMINI